MDKITNKKDLADLELNIHGDLNAPSLRKDLGVKSEESVILTPSKPAFITTAEGQGCKDADPLDEVVIVDVSKASSGKVTGRLGRLCIHDPGVVDAAKMILNKNAMTETGKESSFKELNELAMPSDAGENATRNELDKLTNW